LEIVMYEEVLGKALFASVAVWFIVVTAQVIDVAPQAEQIASLPERSGSTVG
jgi:hypothetical protein